MNHLIQNSTQITEPFVLQRRIGSTTFRVNARFSETSKETLDDKILRLLKSDLNHTENHATIDLLQTGRLPERSPL
ncbi:MAG: transposon-encoded TnpW family protein [Oscillospiraceae bacterium]|nr:transposon-encoded TnpW family protein [Oscillospiraceae bacterium]